MIGNKIADRVTKKPRNKMQKEDDRIMQETQELIIPPEKIQQIIKNLNKIEYDKINNLLGSQSEKLSKFVTREYVRVNSLSSTYYKNKSIRFKTPMLRSDLCDYADAYILVSGKITVNGIVNGAENEINRRNRP